MNPFTAYQSLIQTWVNTVEHAQANMLAFHQAVSSIQGYRARALGQWWQQAPQHISNILQSQSPGDAMANLTLWQGQTVLAANTLNNDTQAVRAHLLKVWSRTFAPAQQATSSSTQTKASTSTATITPPTPVSTPKTAAPAPKPAKTEPTPIAATEAPPAPKPVKVAETKPVETTSTQPTTPVAQPAPQLATQATAQVITLPTPQPSAQQEQSIAANGDVTITPTATSFARNTGHALNASAAPRRTASIPLRRSARR